MNSVVLYLVRHGAIRLQSEKTFIGQIDLPLSEQGVEQAWALRQWLEPVRFSRLFSSDLSRSRHTCQIIAGPRNASVAALPALREINLGSWEGISFNEIRSRFPGQYAARGRDIENWRPPAGESFVDCLERVQLALAEILAGAEGNVLLVAHAGVNRLILCDTLGISLKNLHSLGQDYGCVNILEFERDRARIRLMNYVPFSSRPMQRANHHTDAAHGSVMFEASS